jgi:hypothetical protein
MDRNSGQSGRAHTLYTKLLAMEHIPSTPQRAILSAKGTMGPN